MKFSMQESIRVMLQVSKVETFERTTHGGLRCAIAPSPLVWPPPHNFDASFLHACSCRCITQPSRYVYSLGQASLQVGACACALRLQG